MSNWKTLTKVGVSPLVAIEKLQKVIALLASLGRRYSDENMNLRCLPDRCGLSIQNVQEVKSIIFVVVFDTIGRLN
jgi:hypothetical protein